MTPYKYVRRLDKIGAKKSYVGSHPDEFGPKIGPMYGS